MRLNPQTLAVLMCVLVAAACGDGQSAPTPADVNALTIDTRQPLRPINRNLLGIHARDDAATVADRYDDIAPRTHRHVMSRNDFLHYDCATGSVDPSSLEHFNRWLDAVYAEGAEPILSLSYVPECIARDGQPKGPPTDPVVYRQFLDALFTALVTNRMQANKPPLDRFELWNEPDIPIDAQAEGSGHGFVGTLNEYVESNLPVLAAAVLAVERESGAQIRVGAPASFSPWPFSPRYGANLAEMLASVNGFDTTTASSLAALADQAYLTPHVGLPASERIMTFGGFVWPRRIIDEAASLGLEIDFVSVHLYPNTPLGGAAPAGTPEPAILMGRNPFASPEDFAELAAWWSAEFPGKELIVSEWSLSAGVEWRHATCEGAAFNAAALSVMQGSAIDRALFLGRPAGPADAAFRAWAQMPATQVAASLPADVSNVWVTAAADSERTTVLAAQWHTRLVDAIDIRLPATVKGLVDGDYLLTVEWIGAGHATVPGRSEATVRVTNGRVNIPEPLPLVGQSVVRADLRRAGAPPLPTLTLAAAVDPEPTCLVDAAVARSE